MTNIHPDGSSFVLIVCTFDGSGVWDKNAYSAFERVFLKLWD
jgi:hypothetical protein